MLEVRSSSGECNEPPCSIAVISVVYIERLNKWTAYRETKISNLDIVIGI